jgi:Transposase IS4
MSETDAKRTFGRAWNTRLVSGTVLSMVENGSGKRISVSVDVMWDLPAGPKARTVNVRSVTAGNAPGAAGHATEVPTPAAGQAVVTDAEQDGVHRDQQLSAYSEGGLPSPPDPGDSLATVTEWTAHGTLWKEEDVLEPVGGAVPRCTWSMRTLSGEAIVEGGDSGSFDSPRRPYDYFMPVFPTDKLVRMVRLTNEKLNLKKRPCTTTAELLKFIDVLILGTRYEFGSRADLWKTEATNRLFIPPAFGMKTGMSRGRFDDIWTCLTFSRQATRTEDQCSAEHRWQLVADFVQSINHHRAANFTPSDRICVDESISR